MKLQSMTAFVLEQCDKYVNDRETPANVGLHRYLSNTSRYAKFLTTPLELGMFVPCDEDGNVLTEPKDYNDHSIHLGGAKEKYQKAKWRVLFEGFEIVEYPDVKSGITETVSYKNTAHVFWFDSISQTWNPSIGLRKIEDLTSYGITFKEEKLWKTI